MIHFIVGTRAQMVKIAPLVRECIERDYKYNFILFSQHKSTMSKMMKVFQIGSPDFKINDWGRDITSASEMVVWSISTMLKALKNKKRIFKNDRSGVVIVHGDAPPALLGAIIAKSQGLKVAHVESGLRSFNFFNPFPEELTRVLLWKFGLVDYYFCQDRRSFQNIKKYRGKKTITNYNTLFDSLKLALINQKKIKVKLPKKYAVVTLHRYELLRSKEKMTQIVKIIKLISENMHLLFVLHPPTKKFLERYQLFSQLESISNIELRPRYDYFTFIKILKNSEFVISDGGSNQEECFYLGKPCILFRNETERVEGLGKNVILSKFDEKLIFDFVNSYKKYSIKPEKSVVSPSKIIMNNLAEFKE